jgi:hypothetical protein
MTHELMEQLVLTADEFKTLKSVVTIADSDFYYCEGNNTYVNLRFADKLQNAHLENLRKSQGN